MTNNPNTRKMAAAWRQSLSPSEPPTQTKNSSKYIGFYVDMQSVHDFDLVCEKYGLSRSEALRSLMKGASDFFEQ